MEEFLKVLKKALLAAGLKEGSDEFKAAITPTHFEGYFNKLKEKAVKLPTTLEEALKLPGIQSLYDKKITDAVQKRESNLKDEWDFVKKGTAPKEETPIEKKIRKLQEKQAKDDADKTLATKKTDAAKLLKDKKIHKKFIKHFDFNSETELAEQLKDVESVFSEITQSIITENGGTKLPVGKGDDGKVTKEQADKIVDRM